MSFQNDDLLLVNRSGTSFKTEYGLLRERIIEGVGGATVSETEPTGEHEGDLWYQPSTDSLFVWVVGNTTGVVTSCTVRNGGSGYTSNETNVATIGGDGEGLTLDIQAGVGGNFTSPIVNQGGSGYAVGNVVFLTGAGNQNGSATVTAVNMVATGAWEAVDSGIEDAPSDGQLYGRQNGDWEVVTGGGDVTTIQYSGAAAWGTVNPDGTKGVPGLNYTSAKNGGTGLYRVTFDSPMPNNQYSVQLTGTTGTEPAGVATVATRTDGFDYATYSTSTGALADISASFAVHALNALPPKGGTGADAWGNVAADGTLNGSFNCTVNKQAGNGVYTVTFNTPMPDANYSVVQSTENTGIRATYFDKTPNSFNIYTTTSLSDTLNDGASSFVVHATNAQLPDTVTQEQIEAAINNPGASAWGIIDMNAQLLAGMNCKVASSADGFGFRVTFDNPMPSANYAITACAATRVGLVSDVAWTDNDPDGFTLYVKDQTGSAVQAGVSFAVHATNALPPRGGTGADAWVLCNSDGTTQSSFNIAGTTRTGLGLYDVVFTTPMPSADYSVLLTIAANTRSVVAYNTARTVNGFSVKIANENDQHFDFDFSAVVHATNAQLPDTITMQMWDDLVARVTALENA